jgi:acyl carrier protein
MTQNKLDQIQAVFRDFFNSPSLIITLETTASDIESWDSLSHVDLMMVLEEKFNVRLPTKIIMNANNVGDLIGHL